MESCVRTKLQNLGYRIYDTPYAYIESAMSWYRNEVDEHFHKRTSITGESYEIERLNFAKRGCEDDANLCEIVSINAGDDTQSEDVRQILARNRFEVMYRKQLELMSAAGTSCAYIRLDNATYLDNGKVTGGDIRITYCEAENYVPLTVVNDDVIEAAFSGTDITKDGKRSTLVVFSFADGLYKAETYIFDKHGKEIESYWIQLGDVRPFAVMRVAEVNNIRYMDGFGLPKVFNAIPTLKKIELVNMILNGDLERGEKLILTNEVIVDIDRNTGKPKKKNNLMKRLFVFLGDERLPDMKSIVQEYNPEIRIEPIQKTMEFCLSLFSMMFGFGTKQYKFENGQIQTATQYIGERQDAMKSLNRQRKESTDYICGIIRAIEWFANTFQGTAYDLDAEICIDFDDSYIEDKNTLMDSMKTDATMFSDIPEFTVRYIMKRLNLSREEAMKVYEGKIIEEEEEQED